MKIKIYLYYILEDNLLKYVFLFFSLYILIPEKEEKGNNSIVLFLVKYLHSFTFGKIVT